MGSRSWRRSKTRVGRAGSWKSLQGRWESVRGNWTKNLCLLLLVTFRAILWGGMQYAYHHYLLPFQEKKVQYGYWNHIWWRANLECFCKYGERWVYISGGIMQTQSIQYNGMGGTTKTFMFKTRFWLLCQFPLSYSAWISLFNSYAHWK